MDYREIIKEENNMTRFQIAVIKDGVIYTSTEFNGDGYWTGHGEVVYEALKRIATVKEWKEYVTKFNSETFEYTGKLHYKYEDEYDDLIDMSKDYIENWFSDYIYIKNIGNEDVEFTTENGKTTLIPDEIAVFNFGERLIPGTYNPYGCIKEPLELNEDLIREIQNHGYSIDFDDNGQITFGKYSPAGQDFFFTVDGDSLEELANNIYNYYENYDVSYEAYLWLDKWGHGRNGAPYDMKDVYEDMETCQEYIYELYEIIREEL
jgi:hypothetical protein